MSSRTGRASSEPGLVADIPDRIDLDRHRELTGFGFNRPVRYILLAIVVGLAVLGLLGVFGQRPETTTAKSAKADLELFAPSRLRGGLLYEARLTIRAHATLSHAVLQLQPGWLESQQLNTIEPSPIAESSRNGSLVLTLGTVEAGEHHTLFLEFQVNPTNVGRRSAGVILYDGDERLLAIHRKLTVYP